MLPTHIAVHGHRGARAVFPENTIPAFAYAIQAGADYIELDVQVTRDDVLVACHDPVLKRRRAAGPPGSRVVRELTLEELRQFDCGVFKNRRFRRQVPVPGTRIPTLEEVFRLATCGRFRFNIEVKSLPGKPQYTPEPEEYARLLLDTIRRHRMERRVQVQSFDFRVLEMVRDLDGKIPLALLYELRRRDPIGLALAVGAASVGPYHRLVTRRTVARAHDAGLKVVPWTVNRPREWSRLIRAGVDGIITDDPAALIVYLEECGLRAA